MCMEDVRLGRDLAPIAKLVPVATGSVVNLLGPDPLRTRITFSGDAIGTLYIGCEGVTPTAASGFACAPGAPIFQVDVERWGRLITGPWTAFASAGTIQCAIQVASLEKL